MGSIQGKKMNYADACQILQVDVTHMDAATIRARWAAHVREVHPDTADIVSASGKAAWEVHRLTLARDYLLEYVAREKRACKLCNGVGTVRQRLGTLPCVACNGTGEST